MALTTIEYGSLASSATLNNNFNYLDGRITTTATSVSTLSSQISTINTNLTNNKANTDLSNVTDTVLTGKLSSTVLTNAGCLTSGNISSASNTVKSTITAWGMPDYSNGISVTVNTDYTCTANGWILIQSRVADGGSRYLYINSTQYDFVASAGNYYDTDFAIIPVSAGDIVKLTSGTIKFYPMKGAN